MGIIKGSPGLSSFFLFFLFHLQIRALLVPHKYSHSLWLSLSASFFQLIGSQVVMYSNALYYCDIVDEESFSDIEEDGD